MSDNTALVILFVTVIVSGSCLIGWYLWLVSRHE